MSNNIKKNQPKSTKATSVSKATDKTSKVLNLAPARSNVALEAIRKSAHTEFILGRKATYKAIALTYIWFEVSYHNPTYLKKAFEPFSKHTNSHKYASAIKVCLNLCPKSSAPTISKYKSVMLFIHSQFYNHSIKTADDKTIKLITDLITNTGGLNSCIAKYNATSSANSNKKSVTKKPPLTKDQINNRAKRYQSKAAKSQATFTPNKNFKAPKSNLVVMIGRVSNNNLEVVDVIVNDSLVAHVIRNK